MKQLASTVKESFCFVSKFATTEMSDDNKKTDIS